MLNRENVNEEFIKYILKWYIIEMGIGFKIDILINIG